MSQLHRRRFAAGPASVTLILLAVLTGCTSLSPEEAQTKRDKIDVMGAATLAELLETRPDLESSFDEAPGYAIASMKLTKVPVFGGSDGAGVVIDKRTGGVDDTSSGDIELLARLAILDNCAVDLPGRLFQ